MIRYMDDIFEMIYLYLRWCIRNVSSGWSDSLVCLTKKTAIVTGGSQGIGYAISLLLASRGCKVIIACRSDATEAKRKIIEITQNPNIELRELDLTSFKSIRSFADNIKKTEEKIDILINNAGIGASRKISTEDGLETVMQTNYFGPFLLTHLLLDSMKASSTGARIIFTSSGLGLGPKVTVNGMSQAVSNDSIWTVSGKYCRSKFCNILAAQEFGKRLEKFGIHAYCADTGGSRTKIYRDVAETCDGLSILVKPKIFEKFLRDPHNAAQTSFHLATSKEVNGDNGGLYFRCKPFPKPKALKSQNYCDELWKKSEELVDLKPEEKIEVI